MCDRGNQIQRRGEEDKGEREEGGRADIKKPLRAFVAVREIKNNIYTEKKKKKRVLALLA